MSGQPGSRLQQTISLQGLQQSMTLVHTPLRRAMVRKGILPGKLWSACTTAMIVNNNLRGSTQRSTGNLIPNVMHDSLFAGCRFRDCYSRANCFRKDAHHAAQCWLCRPQTHAVKMQDAATLMIYSSGMNINCMMCVSLVISQTCLQSDSPATTTHSSC